MDRKSTDVEKTVPSDPLEWTTVGVSTPHSGSDNHGSTATVNHSWEMKKRLAPHTGFDMRDNIAQVIVGGVNLRAPVSVWTKSDDPWSFGTAEQGAIFPRDDAGFDCSFSVYAGTAFGPFGSFPPDAVLPPTIMDHSVRVANGVLNHAEAFWASPEGAIDLYSVRISAGMDLAISVDLQFGQSNDRFSLNFKDSQGNPFDPDDSAAIDALKLEIRNAFTLGMVQEDRLDMFSVGFVPLGSDPYTSGMSSALETPSIEVPSPGITAMILLGGVWASRRRRNESVN